MIRRLVLLALLLLPVVAYAATRERSVKAFRAIGARTGWAAVEARFGAPDADIGSGIHIYVYRLADGSEVRIGTPDRKQILYVIHHRRGKDRTLYRVR